MRITLVFKKGRLPEGWIKTKIQNLVLNSKVDIVDGPFGSNLKAIEYVKDGIPLIRLQNVGRNQFVNKNIKYITKEKAESLRRHNFQRNDIVITKLGKPLGVSCLVPDYLSSGIIVADIIRVRVSHDLISRKFLIYAINSDELVTQFEKYTKGTTRPRVNLTKFRDFQISIPPFTEQKRIVTKIESIFAQIDAAKEQLKCVLELTKICSQSVLKYAFEGKLTEEWRSGNKHDVNIRWFDYNKRKKSIMKISTKNFQNVIIPHKWCWLDIESLSTSLKNGIYKQKQFYVENGVSCLRMYNINNWKLIWKNIKHLQLTSTEISEYKLEFNDILINRVNSRELVGKSALIPMNIEKCVFESKNIRLRLKTKYINPQFVHLWLIFASKYYFYNHFQQTTGMASINQTQIKKLPIPFCSTNEQKYIVSKIESIFGNIDTLNLFYFIVLGNLFTNLRYFIILYIPHAISDQ